jgi:hypothetical protein
MMPIDAGRQIAGKQATEKFNQFSTNICEIHQPNQLKVTQGSSHDAHWPFNNPCTEQTVTPHLLINRTMGHYKSHPPSTCHSTVEPQSTVRTPAPKHRTYAHASLTKGKLCTNSSPHNQPHGKMSGLSLVITAIAIFLVQMHTPRQL